MHFEVLREIDPSFKTLKVLSLVLLVRDQTQKCVDRWCKAVFIFREVYMSNELELFNQEKTMTTKELAESLGVTPRTIQQVVEKLGLAKLISQVKIRGQYSYAFTEAQATAIKIELQNHSKIARNGFDTLSISNDLEAWELQKRLDAYKDRRIAELTEENKRKQAIIDRIANGKGCFSMEQTAKALKLPYGRNKLFEKLRERGILSDNNSPKQDQVNANHFKTVVKYINESVGNRTVTLTTGKGLVYLANLFNAEIDGNVQADA